MPWAIRRKTSWQAETGPSIRSRYWNYGRTGTGEIPFFGLPGLGECRTFGSRNIPDIWKSIPQDQLPQRLDEVPPDRQVILVCNTGVRSFEAQIALDQAGLGNCLNLQGGMAALKKSVVIFSFS